MPQWVEMSLGISKIYANTSSKGNIYLLKAAIQTLGKGVECVQSLPF